MDKKFSVDDYLRRLGARLVGEFKDAEISGTPGLIGSAREHPARRRLEGVLPGFTAVKTGIVMDSFGAFSRQQDIVVHERELCPVYSVNDDPGSGFFPIEGVIAVGEVKSTLTKAKLVQGLENVCSAQVLRRNTNFDSSNFLHPGSVPYRAYGNRSLIAGDKSEGFDQEKVTDQIFTFILCQKFGISPKAILSVMRDFSIKNGRNYLPNIVASLADGFVCHMTFGSFELNVNASHHNSEGMGFSADPAAVFPYLIRHLSTIAMHGRTVSTAAFGAYVTAGAIVRNFTDFSSYD